MAGRQLNGRIEASVLLEVVVAMVAIVAVFGIAMMIYGNVLRLSLSAKKIQGQAVLQQLILKDEQHPGDIAGDTTVNGFFIVQDTTQFNNQANLETVSLTAYDENRQKIAFLQKVIPVKP